MLKRSLKGRCETPGPEVAVEAIGFLGRVRVAALAPQEFAGGLLSGLGSQAIRRRRPKRFWRLLNHLLGCGHLPCFSLAVQQIHKFAT